MNLFNDFMKNLRRFGLEYFNRYYSTYPGIVMDNVDPDKRGRIKIQLPTILGNGRTHTQWAEPSGVNLAGKNHGEFFPPYINDYVDVWFENGDLNFPKYKGGYYAQKELHKDFQTNYPNVKGWIFSSGQKIVVDETKGSEQIRLINKDNSQFIMDANTKAIYMIHSSGANFQIAKDGSIKLFASDGSYIFIDTSKGAISLHGSAGGVFSTSDKPVLSDKSGKQIINLTDSDIQINASGNIINSCSSFQINAGNISASTKGAISIGNLVGTLEISTAGSFKVNGPLVDIGAAPSFGCGVGDNIESRLTALETALMTFVITYNVHIHTATSIGAPTTPPMVPASPFVPIPLPAKSFTIKVSP